MSKPSKPTDNFAELIAALQAERTGTDDSIGMTTRELSEQLQRSDKWVQERLRKAKAAGRITIVKKWIDTLDGKRLEVPAYAVRGAGKHE